MCKENWLTIVDRILMCERDPTVDGYVVTLKKDRLIIRHLSKKAPDVCSLFLWREGIIQCRVTGKSLIWFMGQVQILYIPVLPLSLVASKF